MNRRSFLRGMFGAAAIAATNPVHFLAPIGGWQSKTIVNPNNRIDALDLRNWFRQEITPIDFYEVGGQTIFPVYGSSGGLATGMLSYLRMSDGSMKELPHLDLANRSDVMKRSVEIEIARDRMRKRLAA